MKILLSSLVLLNILDAGITHILVWLGIACERNPFLERIVGEPVFMSLKLVGSLFCAVVLWDIHRRHPRLARGTTIVAVTAYSAIVLWNLSLFWRQG